jgi:hypothetical protein
MKELHFKNRRAVCDFQLLVISSDHLIMIRNFPFYLLLIRYFWYDYSED